MNCSGLHCAGCAGGMAVPVVPLLEVYGLAWVAEHIIEVAIVSAACGALAVAAVVAIMRWQDRRQAARAAQGTLFITRADAPPSQLARAARPAIGPVYNFNFYTPAGDAQAAVIRKAITGPAADAITEGK
jgi:cobalamin synthase